MKKHMKKADGGKAGDAGPAEKEKANLYNAKGAPEAKEAEDEKDGFKKGGKACKKGGAVHGEKSAKRLDKRARGGRMSEKSPFSSAMKGEEPGKQSSGKGSGHEDEQLSDFNN